MARPAPIIIVAHMGVTTGGAIGAKAAKSLEQCADEIAAIAAAARGVRDDVIVLCHGGPIAMPDDAQLHPRRALPTATAFTARVRWSGCRSRPPSRAGRGFQGRCKRRGR